MQRIRDRKYLKATLRELRFTLSLKINTFAYNANVMDRKPLNRIKVVLVENSKSNKWLAERLGKNEATVSRWCTNDVQPSLETLSEIAKLLNVNVKDLINS